MRFELPATARLVHEMVMPLRWGDMDAMGHINNTTVLPLHGSCRLDWIFKLTGSRPSSRPGPAHHQRLLQLPAPA
jgi:acyl-CoA thioester hydrolase